MSENQSEQKDSAADDLSDIFDDVLQGHGRPETLDKLINLLEAGSELLSDLRSGEIADPPGSAVNGKGFLQSLQVILSSALSNPDSLAKHYGAFAARVLDVLRQDSDLQPAPGDRRFKHGLWRDSAFFRGLMQIYLAWGEHMQAWVDDQDIGEDDQRRVQFIFEQFIAALAPSNLPINPAALQRAELSMGQTAVSGIKNWIQDVRFNQSMPRQINDGVYTLGVDLAITPGHVVYRNEVLELIQYAPQTEYVRRRPLLLIPPQINKYYIFDLKPKNSLLGFLVRQGFQVFTLSWRNPDKDDAHWGIETYIKATLEAIEVMRAITRSRTVNLVSACAGGMTAVSLLGYLAETGNRLVHSHSLLVTALLPRGGSVLELFITNDYIELARKTSHAEGTMDGRDLAHLFAWLRPNDLVWNYWVNNYIMGRQPPPLDVLYWDNDSTRLPAALHSDFIDMFRDDVYRRPHGHSLFGVPIDYRKVRVDTYFVGGREDYLMPWNGIYRQVHLFRGNHRFVLSTSGHVQSMLRPPHLSRTEYFTNESLPDSADDWLANATRQDGTWWYDWADWLHAQSGANKKAPSKPGNRDFPPITPAPGDYVMVRI